VRGGRASPLAHRELAEDGEVVVGDVAGPGNQDAPASAPGAHFFGTLSISFLTKSSTDFFRFASFSSRLIVVVAVPRQMALRSCTMSMTMVPSSYTTTDCVGARYGGTTSA